MYVSSPKMIIQALVLLIVFLTCQAAQAHIFDQYQPTPLADGYGTAGFGTPLDQSYGDITFVGQYPSPDSLSVQEQYMLGGTTGAPAEFSPNGFPSWNDFVIRAAILYWRVNGTLPERMTPEVYAAAYDIPVAEVSPVVVELLKSPLTGEYPYLNSADFSPGNLFIKLLTPEERKHFAGNDEFYYECWFNSRVPNSQGGFTAVEFQEPVYYARVYGWNGVIYNGIRFTFGTLD